MRIIFLGPQGSGKGTQGKLLAAKLGIPHISTGTLLREIAHSDSPHAEVIANAMHSGVLVSDELMQQVTQERISQPDCSSGFILDGVPRTLVQAQMIDEMTTIDHVIHVDVSKEESMRRIESRRQQEHREDDEYEVILVRLGIYYEQTAKLIDYYGEKNILRTVDGEQSINEVEAEIDKVFNV